MKTTTTTVNTDLAIPTGLSKQGRAAAKEIVKFITEKDMAYTGGCEAFYTPEDWKARGELYGRESELIVCHEGGNVGYFFSYDAAYEMGSYDLLEKMNERLKTLGLYAEQCTRWYSAIYAI